MLPDFFVLFYFTYENLEMIKTFLHLDI